MTNLNTEAVNITGKRKYTLRAMAITLCVIFSLMPIAGAAESQNNSSNISNNAITNQNSTNKEEIAKLQEWLTKRNFKASITEDLKISNLSIGATGENVVALQTWLKEHGFYAGKIDGQFGSDTEQAVKRFQNATGITEDGWVGIKTLKAMKQWEQQNGESSQNSSKTQDNDSSQAVSDNYSTKKHTHTTYKNYPTHSYYNGYYNGRGTGDCWVNSNILYNRLTSSGEKARIIQYGTSMSPRHRSVQLYNHGKWVDYNYKANGYAKRYYATKKKPGAHVVK